VSEKRRELFLNPIPRHALREHRKRVSEIDHLIQSGAQKNQSYSSETSPQNLREIASNDTSFWEIPPALNPSKSLFTLGFAAF
jgi:hypothetical protein